LHEGLIIVTDHLYIRDCYPGTNALHGGLIIVTDGNVTWLP
jgi:hypothetical protein